MAPFVSLLLAKAAMTVAADRLLHRSNLSPTTVAKIFNTIGSFETFPEI